MAEKKYLVTHYELRSIAAEEWNKGAHDNMDELSCVYDDEWLAAHEHRERTCHLILTNMYGGDEGYTEATCSLCGAVMPMPEPSLDDEAEVLPHEYSYCPNCRARVIGGGE